MKNKLKVMPPIEDDIAVLAAAEDGEVLVLENVAQHSFSRRDYQQALDKFDSALCEITAVSQAAANRIAPPHHGYGTHVLVGICNAATAMIRAAPLSRWVRSDFQHWAFSAVAAHARAIIEGHILFAYLMETPESEEAWSAKLNVMHLNDCTRRITLHTNLGAEDEVAGFIEQAEEIKARLRGNPYFMGLPEHVKRRCLEGDSPMIATRSEMLEKLGWDRNAFRAIYDLLSQHAHILPVSFYRLEPNGRGTGLENPVDRSYIGMMLQVCEGLLSDCTDKMVDAFPDTVARRHGKKSRFSPGPREIYQGNIQFFNLSRHVVLPTFLPTTKTWISTLSTGQRRTLFSFFPMKRGLWRMGVNFGGLD